MRQLVNSDPPGWVEIDLRQFRRNWAIIFAHKPAELKIAFVLKDDAYGHGAVPLARVASECGVEMFAVASVGEALELRNAGIEAPVLVLGERAPREYALCSRYNLTPCVGSPAGLAELKKAVQALGQSIPIHLKLDTGMSRYGFRWSALDELFRELRASPEVPIEGIMSHFAMSDESDKTFARTQLSRFNRALEQARAAGLDPKYRHICNSGGFLDLPEAHFNLARIGILPLGVYPSKVCRRLEGIAPVMRVKSRIAMIKELEPGDHVGYGMRFTAAGRMRIGVVPVGYGHGFPRVRNQGRLLVHGQEAAILGGVSMDAITIDLTAIVEARPWDEVTLLGRDGSREITIHDLANLRNSVSYDAMVSWSPRLPRRYIE